MSSTQSKAVDVDMDKKPSLSGAQITHVSNLAQTSDMCVGGLRIRTVDESGKVSFFTEPECEEYKSARFDST